MTAKLNQLIILITLYLAFVSLGLPDQLLGISWPNMRGYFGKPLDWAGILVFMTAILTALSGFLSGYFINKFPVSAILIVSCSLTALGLTGYGVSTNSYGLITATIPLGLGAGAIDASLNNYVANNYSSRHMNWLHACWGIGSTLGPAIMTYAVSFNNNWRWGYGAIAIIQIFLVVIFIVTASLWKNNQISRKIEKVKNVKVLSFKPLMSLGIFFVYSCVEFSVGLWFYSVMIEKKFIPAETAGSWIVFYWGSLTLGRIAIGFISNHLGNARLVDWGIKGAFWGLMLLNTVNQWVILGGLIVTGFSLSVIYPAMMHETPKRFGTQTGAILMGYQAGIASLGVAILAPAAGVFISRFSLNLLVPLLMTLVASMAIMNYFLKRR